MEPRPIRACDADNRMMPSPIGRPPKCPVPQPFPEQPQASPSHAKIFTRSARLEDRPRERILAERLAHQRRKPVAPFLKSTGLVTTSTRMPTGTVIMTPPSPRAAPSATWRHRSRAQSEPSQRRSYDRAASTITVAKAQMQCRPCRPRLPPAAYPGAIRITLGDDPRLLL